MNIAGALRDLGIRVVKTEETRVVCGCPLRAHEHDDTSPAFNVYLDNGWWVCYKGCGRGPLIALVQRLRNCGENEAGVWVQARGAELDVHEIERYLPCVVTPPNLAPFYLDYSRQRADITSSYLLGRGFTTATVRSWGLRYDTETQAIVIPAVNQRRELVGVIRRAVPGSPLPDKYISSPGFEKS